MSIDKISATGYGNSNNASFSIDRSQDTLIDFLKECVKVYSTSDFQQLRADFDACIEKHATGDGLLKEIEIINNKAQPKIADVLSYMNADQANRFKTELFEDMVPLFHERLKLRDIFANGGKNPENIKVEGSFVSRWLMKFLAKHLPEDAYNNAMVFTQKMRWVDDNKKDLTIRTKMGI